MGELYAYGSEVTSVFQLIGTLEDDITKSIACIGKMVETDIGMDF